MDYAFLFTYFGDFMEYGVKCVWLTILTVAEDKKDE